MQRRQLAERWDACVGPASSERLDVDRMGRTSGSRFASRKVDERYQSVQSRWIEAESRVADRSDSSTAGTSPAVHEASG